jgi:glycosyltransferase involved in cell wall biosynthesis
MTGIVSGGERTSGGSACRLSLIVPCYNEGDVLEHTIPGLFDALQTAVPECELILVDNGSTDDTADVIDGLCKRDSRIRSVTVPENLGYGLGVLTGYEAANGDCVGHIPADGPVAPEDVARLALRAMSAGPGSFLSAVRMNRQDTTIRRFVSGAYNRVFRILFGTLTDDINGTPKFADRGDLARMALQSRDYFLEAEMMIKGRRLGLDLIVAEVPSMPREVGRSKVSATLVKTCAEFVRNLLKARFGRLPTAPPTAPGAVAPVSPGALFALLAMLGATAFLYFLYWSPFGVDDSWITYRYAENLADGKGFVYNVGERVLGTTTPLYAGILALAALAGLSVPHVSWVIGGLGAATALVLLFHLVRRLYSEAAGLLAVGLLGSAYVFHGVATFGMETPFYVCLVLGAFLSFLTGREVLAAALAALCLLTRLDGAAVGASLFLMHLIGKRQFPWRPAAVYLTIVLPWFLFSYAYFGSWGPNSMAAKKLHTGNRILLWMPRWLIFEPRAWLAGVGALVLLLSQRTRLRAAPPILWAAAYATAFALARIHRYDWYLTPLMVVLAGLAAVGILASVEMFGDRFAVAPGVRKVLLVGLVGAVIVPDGYRTVRRMSGDEGILGVERPRYEAAIWMRDNLPEGAPIAVGGIGLVGYHTDRTIYDAMGLVTPGVMRLDRPLDDAWNVPFPRFLPAVIEDYDPEFVFDGFWLDDGEDMPEFMKGKYELVKEWRGANPGWPAFILYRRIESASPLASE